MLNVCVFSVATPNTLREMVKRVLHPRVAVVHQVSIVCVVHACVPHVISLLYTLLIYSYPLLLLPSHLLIALIRYNNYQHYLIHTV